MKEDPWLLRRCVCPPVRLRLICLPHAGGAASVFRNWPEAAPRGVEVCRVQLPGRENRLAEEPLTTMDGLMDELMGRVVAMNDLPLAIFGHSMGGLVAYELAARLEKDRGVTPELLVTAGVRPPRMVKYDPISHLDDAAFIEGLRKRGGTPEQVLRSDELMELLLPMVRADFTLAESYRPPERPPLATPVVAFCGKHDEEATPTQMTAWRAHTRGGFSLRLFEGGHFFVRSHEKLVQREMFGLLTPLTQIRPWRAKEMEG